MVRNLLTSATLVLAGLLPTVIGQEKKPELKGLDKATVEAWEKRGFKATWMGVARYPSVPILKDSWKLATSADPKDLEGAVPTFVLDREFVAKNKVTLADLPPVDVPFGLRLTSGPSPDELRHLAALKNLTRLDMGDTRLTDDDLKHLAELKGLTALAVSKNGPKITGEGLKHLAGLTNLTYLDLSVNDITGDGLKNLAGLKKLTHLNLRENYKFTGAGLGQFTDLTHLNVAATRVTNESLAALAGMKNLTSLDLNNAFVLTGDGLKHIAGLPNLTTLDLRGTRLQAANLAHLSNLKKLTSLELTLGNKLTDEALGHLHTNGLLHITSYATATDGKRPTKPDEVVVFDLSETAATDEGAKFLAGFANLTTLKLKRLGPTEGAGFKQLAGLKKLTAIHLPAEVVTDQLLKALDEAGLIHTLAPWMTAADAARPTKADEVVAAELSARRNGFAGAKVTDAGLKHLASLTNLTSLKLCGSAVKGDGLAALSGLKHLTSLDLSESQVTGDNLKHLSMYANLAHLDLSQTAVTGGSLVHLADLKNLETLTLRQLRTGTAGLAADDLKHLAGLAKLTTLDLTQNRVAGAGLVKLAGLEKLTTLKLDRIDDTTLQGLAEAGLVHALSQAVGAGGKRPTKIEDIVSLDLSFQQVSDKGLKHLAGMTNLTTLNLRSGNTYGAGLKHLAGMKKLALLDAGAVTDDALEALRDAGLLHALAQATAADGKRPTKAEDIVALELFGRGVTNKGLKAIYGLTSLKMLSLRGTGVTDAGVEELKVALPKCVVAK